LWIRRGRSRVESNRDDGKTSHPVQPPARPLVVESKPGTCQRGRRPNPRLMNAIDTLILTRPTPRRKPLRVPSVKGRHSPFGYILCVSWYRAWSSETRGFVEKTETDPQPPPPKAWDEVVRMRRTKPIGDFRLPHTRRRPSCRGSPRAGGDGHTLGATMAIIFRFSIVGARSILATSSSIWRTSFITLRPSSM